MIAHRLNQAVSVYRPAYADDGAGGQTRTLELVGTVRAQVSQPSAEERTMAASWGANLTHVVHTTYASDVQRGDELAAGGPRNLRVMAVVHDSRTTYKRLECEVTQGE